MPLPPPIPLVEEVVDAQGREKRRQPDGAEGPIPCVPEDHGPADEDDHRYRQTNIRVMNRPSQFLIHADKSPHQRVAQDQVEQGESRSCRPTDVPTDEREFLYVCSRRPAEQS